MRKAAYFLFTFSFFLLLVSAATLFLANDEIQSEKFYASVNVSDRAGFDINGSALTFGSIQRPGSSSRRIIIENKYPFPVVVYISAEGNIEKILDFEDVIRLDSGEEKVVSFSAISSNDIEEGFYFGNVRFRMLRDYR